MTEVEAYEIYSWMIIEASRLKGGNAVRESACAKADDWYRNTRREIAQ
jgi:hypothetical protein